jgi:hypothetical protein
MLHNGLCNINFNEFDIQRTVHRDIFYNKTNEMHSFLKFIFGIEFYTFRTVSLSIIRSLALYTQQEVYVIEGMLAAC